MKMMIHWLSIVAPATAEEEEDKEKENDDTNISHIDQHCCY